MIMLLSFMMYMYRVYRLFPTRDGSAMSYFAQPLQKHEIVVIIDLIKHNYSKHAIKQHSGTAFRSLASNINIYTLLFLFLSFIYYSVLQNLIFHVRHVPMLAH